MNFDEHQRTLLSKLADVLIPEAHDMPSASQADVAGKWLDAVLEARPDLITPLEEVLQNVESDHVNDVVTGLHDKDPVAFGVLAEIASAAYFMNPQVKEAIGYSGQEPRSMDPRADYMEDGLLESVIRRGPIYRPTPRS